MRVHIAAKEVHHQLMYKNVDILKTIMNLNLKYISKKIK